MTTAEELLAGRRRVTLMRHGEVSYFDADGRPRDPRSVPLTAWGRAQAASAAEAMRGVRFDRVACSGMPRTRETATLVCGDESIIEDWPELREIRAGRFREIPDDSLRAAITRPYDDAGEGGARFIGGEPFDEFRERVIRAWDALLADEAWEELLIVAHDAVNRVILGEVSGAGLQGMAAFEQDLACLNLIDVQGERRYLRAVNLTPWDWAKQSCRMTSMEPVYLGYLPARTGARVGNRES